MNKVYQETPNNVNDILGYVISDVSEIIKILGMNKRFYFYDTCSILYHSNSNNRTKIISYLKSKEAVIVINATVLMELTSNTFKIDNKQVNYIKEISENGIKLILLKEEYTFNVLKKYTSLSNDECNKLLSFAICQMIKSKNKIYEIISDLDKSLQLKFKGVNQSTNEIYTDFFSLARSKKDSEDSLGEELIFLTIILLNKLPGKTFIYLSDDKKSTSQLINIKKYILKYYENERVMQLTTAAIIYKLYNQKIVIDKDVLLEIINCTSNDKRVAVRYIGEYDLEEKTEKFSTEDLIKMIAHKSEIKIII